MAIDTPPPDVRDAMVAKAKPSWAAFEESVPAVKPLMNDYLAAVGK